MSSVSQVAASYAFLLVGADGMAVSTLWVTVGGVAFIAILTVVCYFGIEISTRLAVHPAGHRVGVGLRLRGGRPGQGLCRARDGRWRPSFGGLVQPVHRLFSDLAAAFLLVIFIYWGWDTSLSVNEETKDSARTPGRAAVIATVVLVVIFAVVSTALLAYAGPGSWPPTPATCSAPWRKRPRRRRCQDPDPFRADLAAASTQTTIMPAARVTLSMGAHGALPPRFAQVHPRLQTPGFTTVSIGVISAAIFVALSLISTNVLSDSASAVGMLIAFYYGLTAFACLGSSARPCGTARATCSCAGSCRYWAGCSWPRPSPCQSRRTPGRQQLLQRGRDRGRVHPGSRLDPDRHRGHAGVPDQVPCVLQRPDAIHHRVQRGDLMNHADLIITGGDVRTMNPDSPRAQALAIAGDRIIAVGADSEVLALGGSGTQRIDAAGNTVMPGIIDAHNHVRLGANPTAV